MLVADSDFSLWSDLHQATEVDLFVQEPFPFDDAFARAEIANLGGARVTVLGIEDLIALKRVASRPKDLEDIRALETLRAESEDD